MNLLFAITDRLSPRRAATAFSGCALAALLLVSTLTLHAEDRAVKSRVAPIYPEIAKRMGITGVVQIQATVAPDGKVTAVKTLSGNHMLASAAEDAVQRWRFVPGDSESTVNVDLNFTLNH
jgi:TonB family protein